MVLQTLQQLKDVYGDSVDKIVSSNTAVLMYLISNDKDMLEDLSKLAGTEHVARVTGKTFSKKHGGVIETIDENVSYNVQENEERLLTVDDLMSFTNGEAMVLTAVSRKGNSGEAIRPNPIYNTEDKLLPMAWALHTKGHNSKMFKTEFSNAEVATSVSDTNVIDDIPDFNRLYEKRLIQASYVNTAKKQYLDQMGLTEDDLALMDSDTVADEIMRRINAVMNKSVSGLDDDASKSMRPSIDEYEDNEEQINESVKEYVEGTDRIHQKDRENAQKEASLIEEAKSTKRYFNGTLSYKDFEYGTKITEALSNALFDNVGNLKMVINEDVYEIKQKSNVSEMVLVHKASNKQIAHIETIEDEGSNGTVIPKDRWTINEEFTKLLREVATNDNGIRYQNNNSDKSLDEILMGTKENVEDCFKITNEIDVDIINSFIKEFNELTKDDTN